MWGEQTLNLYCWLSKVAEEKHAYADSFIDPIAARIQHRIADEISNQAEGCANNIKLSLTMRREVKRSSRLFTLMYFSDLAIQRSEELLR